MIFMRKKYTYINIGLKKCTITLAIYGKKNFSNKSSSLHFQIITTPSKYYEPKIQLNFFQIFVSIFKIILNQKLRSWHYLYKIKLYTYIINICAYSNQMFDNRR